MSLVQYGCGDCAPAEWVNFDASPRLRLERIPFASLFLGRRLFARNVRYGNIIHGLPLPPGSCRAVYCSHVLEHLTLEELSRALLNTLKLLAKDGVFRFVIPDLRNYATAYVSDTSPEAAAKFMTGTRLGWKRRPSFLQAIAQSMGFSAHCWMWDYVGIRQELENAGFCDIRPATIGDSQLTEFSAVESPRRWQGHLGVECRKGR